MRHLMLVVVAQILTVQIATPVASADDHTLLVRAGETASNLLNYVQFHAAQPQAPTTVQYAMNSADIWRPLPNTGVNFGITDHPIWLRLQVQNSSDRQGNWVFALSRGYFEAVDIYHVDQSERVRTLLTSRNKNAYDRTLADYSTIAVPVTLEANEKATFMVRYVSTTSTSLRPVFEPVDEFRGLQRGKHYFYFVMVGSICSLVLYNFLSNRLISLRETFFVSMGQLSGFLYYSQELGMLDIYTQGATAAHAGSLNPALAGFTLLFMTLFAREVVAIPNGLHRLTKLWNACLGLAIVLLVWSGAKFADVVPYSRYLIWFSCVLGAIILSSLFLASLYATIRLRRSYWPLVVGWGGMSMIFVTYGLMVIGITPRDIFMSGLYMSTFFIDVMALSMALAYRVADIKKSAFTAERKARVAAEQRAQAYADLSDRNKLMQSFGHDSMQAIYALNLASSQLESSVTSDKATKALDMLKSATSHLSDILSTSLGGVHASAPVGDILCLADIKWQHLTDPVSMIFAAEASKRNVSLTFLGNPDQSFVSDPALMMRVVSNLVSNALKFAEGGQVVVALRHSGNQLRIQIRDNGRGMSAAELKVLRNKANKYKRLDENIEGSGTGLAICHRIVATLQGELVFSARPGRGAIAEIRLPRFDGNESSRLSLIDADAYGEEELAAELTGKSPAQVLVKTADRSLEQRLMLSRYAQLAVYKPVSPALIAATAYYAGCAVQPTSVCETGFGHNSTQKLQFT